jgi:hypothetical protein
VRALAAAVFLAGCSGPAPTDLERSCRGEVVLVCDPHEWTVVRTASLTPTMLGPLDPAAAGTIHAELDACPMRPGAASVQVQALVPESASGDDGPVYRVVDLGVTARDDGTNGDAVADDGTIDWMVTSPFGAEIPELSPIRLRFVPVLAGCTGESYEAGYQTGMRFVPP